MNIFLFSVVCANHENIFTTNFGIIVPRFMHFSDAFTSEAVEHFNGRSQRGREQGQEQEGLKFEGIFNLHVPI